MDKKRTFASVFTAVTSHIMIIIGLDLMVLLVIDLFFNHAMNFLDTDFFRYGCIIFILCGLMLAVRSIFSGSKKASE